MRVGTIDVNGNAVFQETVSLSGNLASNSTLSLTDSSKVQWRDELDVYSTTETNSLVYDISAQVQDIQAKIIYLSGSFLNSYLDFDFDNSFLTLGKLTVLHNLDTLIPGVIFFNNLEDNIVPDNIKVISNNITEIDLNSYAPISGTWKGSIRKSGYGEGYINSMSGGGGGPATDLTNVTTNIIPSIADTFSIGTSAKPFKELHLTGASLYIGTSHVSIVSGALAINNDPIVTQTQVASNAQFAALRSDVNSLSAYDAVLLSDIVAVSSALNSYALKIELVSVSASLNADIVSLSGSTSLAIQTITTTIRDVSAGLRQIDSDNFSSLTSTIQGVSSSLNQTDINLNDAITTLSSQTAKLTGNNIFTGAQNIFLNQLDVGHLNVLGTSTTVDSQTVLINDNILTLNSNVTGAGPYILDSGLNIRRGTNRAATLLWREPEQYWIAGLSGQEQKVVVQTDLNAALSGYYLKTETYDRTEIDNKDIFYIASNNVKAKQANRNYTVVLENETIINAVSGNSASTYGSFDLATSVAVEFVSGAWQNSSTAISTSGASFTANDYYSTFLPYKAFDGSVVAGDGWSTFTGSQRSPLEDWIVVDFGVGNTHTVTGIKYTPWATGSAAPKDIKVEGSNNGSSYTDLGTYTLFSNPTDRNEVTIAITNSTAYRYYRLSPNATGFLSGVLNAYALEIKLLSTINNYIRGFVYNGSAVNINPATVIVKDETNTAISGSGKISLAYEINSGSVSSFYDLESFKTLSSSLFKNITDLKLQVKPLLDSVKVTSLNITTISGGVQLQPNGEVFTTSNGTETHRLSNKANLSDLVTVSGSLNTTNIFEIVDSNIQAKSGYASYPIRSGTGAETFNSSSYTNVGANLSAGAGYYTNKINIIVSTGGTPVSRYPNSAGSDADKLFDGDTGTGWLTNNVTDYQNWFKYTTTDARIATVYRLYFVNYYNPTGWQIQGSNDDFATFDILHTVSGNSTSVGWASFTFSNTIAYKSYRWWWTAGASNRYVSLGEAEFSTPIASFNNTVDTGNLISGTKSIAPASIVVRDENGLSIADGNAVNIAYRVINGSGTTDFATPITLTAFKSLSTSIFFECTELRIRVQPVGTQKISSTNGVSISTPSSESYIAPTGEIYTKVNGVETHRLSNKANLTEVALISSGLSDRIIALSGANNSNILLINNLRTDVNSISANYLKTSTFNNTISGYYNSVQTDSRILFEIVNSNIQAKSGNMGYNFRIGTPVELFNVSSFSTIGSAIISYPGYYQTPLQDDLNPFNYGDYNTSSNTTISGTNYVVSSGTDDGTHFAWKSFDGDDTSYFQNNATIPDYVRIDCKTSKQFKQYRFKSNSFGSAYIPTAWTIQGSNTGAFGGEQVTLDSRTGQNYGTSFSPRLTFNTAISGFRYYQFRVTTLNSGNPWLMQTIEFFYDVSVYNILETSNIITGTKSVAPGSLIVRDENGATIMDGNAVNVAYRTINGSGTTDFATPISLTSFKLLSPSLFVNCTEFKLRIQPVGTQKIASSNPISIYSPSSDSFITPGGEIYTTLNSVETHRLSNKANLSVVQSISANYATTTYVNSVSASIVNGGLKKYTSTFCDGITSSFNITHNLNTNDVFCSIRDISSSQFVDADIYTNSVNSVGVTFSYVPTAKRFRITIIG
jgi:hypothetical protein